MKNSRERCNILSSKIQNNAEWRVLNVNNPVGISMRFYVWPMSNNYLFNYYYYNNNCIYWYNIVLGDLKLYLQVSIWYLFKGVSTLSVLLLSDYAVNPIIVDEEKQKHPFIWSWNYLKGVLVSQVPLCCWKMSFHCFLLRHYSLQIYYL